MGCARRTIDHVHRQRNARYQSLRRAVRRGAPYTVKLLPQPQVDLAFGLRITNWAPCRLSL